MRSLALLALLAAIGSAHAGEGNSQMKALGLDTIAVAILPPPGFSLMTSAIRYEADETVDGNGNPRPGISNFNATFEAVGLRVRYVWPEATLWGAQLESGVASALYANFRIRFDVGGNVHRQESRTSGADLHVSPLTLGWKSDTLHQTAGIEFFVPTGGYTPGSIANIGRGYWSVAPAYRLTWFPTRATEVNVSAMYFYNDENPDTKYTSGREAILEYAVGYKPTASLGIGAFGYCYKQVSDDKGGPSANRGQAYAIGPYLSYRGGKDWGITFKWQREFSVENRAAGNRALIQLMTNL